MNESDNIKFKKISAGFQTSLLLDEEGNVYGCGKCDKFQFGSEYIKEYERIQQGSKTSQFTFRSWSWFI